MANIAQLLDQARTGDVEPLLNAFHGLAFRVALDWLSDPFLAEDAVQEAFIELVTSLDRIREPAALPSLLRRIVRKHADRITRRATPIPWASLDSADPAVLTEEKLRAAAVRRVLGSARAADRLILTMHYLHGSSYEEISRRLGISVGAVRKRLHDARRRLRPKLASALGERKEFVMLGRQIDANGAATDGGTAVDIPVETLEPGHPGDEPLWTGIKVVDLCAPIILGGVIELTGPEGCGQGVLLSELLIRLHAERGACGVVACFAGKRYGKSTVPATLAEHGADKHALLVLEPTASTVGLIGRAVQALVADAKDVLLCVDQDIGTDAVLSMAGIRPAGSVTVVVFAPRRADDPEPEPIRVDTSLVFSRALGYRGLLPAIDPVESRSRLIESGLVSDRHANAAHTLRSTVASGLRLQAFLTQPFDVTEEYTGLAGQHVPVEAALEGVEQISEGIADGVKEDALLYAGTLQHALSRSE